MTNAENLNFNSYLDLEIKNIELKDRIIELEQWKTIAYNAENTINDIKTQNEALSAKNASLTLQNEALRKCLEPFAEYGECVPPSLEKICVTIMLNYGGSGKKVNGTTLLDCSLQGQAFINALNVFSQPTPDPDKISAVVQQALKMKEIYDSLDCYSHESGEFLDAGYYLMKKVEALLNDTKGVG